MMKEIMMMIQETCPHCRNAHRMMEELTREHPEYKDVPLKVVDEVREPAFADSLDYWYVPTYFVDGKKMHEGVPAKEKIRAVYEYALQGS